ncbi:hypothetical protein BGW37DRAFT_475851 [Umbelopsis sp. PMI_123]|nr:hypothetical protein BGW37DRAFT_475851 [Umbelopsis sp. PMI_123]
MLKATAEHTNAITAYRILGFLVRPNVTARRSWHSRTVPVHRFMLPVRSSVSRAVLKTDTRRFASTIANEKSNGSEQHDMYLSAAIHQSDAVTAKALIEILLNSLNQNNVMNAWESYTDLSSRKMIQHLTRDNFRSLVTYFQHHSSGSDFQHGIEFILTLIEDMKSLGYTVGRREKLSMMRVLGLNGRLYEMEQVMCDLENEGLLIVPHDDQKPFRILLASYESNSKTMGKVAVVNKALDVYDSMIDKGVLADGQTTRLFLQILYDAGKQDKIVDKIWKWFWNRIGMEVGSDKPTVHPSLYKGMAMLFAASGKAEQALEIHDLMIKRGIPRDLQLMTAVMHKIGRSGNVNKANELFHVMHVEGMIPNTVTFNALIDVHAHQRPEPDIDGAIRTYNTMLESGIAPDVQTFGTLIHMYSKQGDLSSIQSLYHTMVNKFNVKPNRHIYTNVIGCFVQLEDIESAKAVIRLMKAQHVDADVVTHNMMLHFHARNRDVGQALNILNTMIAAGVQPSVVTFSHILSIYAKNGDVDGGQQLLNKMLEMNIRPNRHTFNILMNLYSHAGDIESVERTFKDLSTRYPPDLISYNTLLQAYIRQNDLEQVLETYRRLTNAYHKADVHTFSHLMTAFASRNNIRGVEGVFNNMKEQNVQPDTVCWSILIQAYCRSGDMDSARKALQQMVESNVAPNHNTLAILVDGCIQSGEIDTAKIIVDKVTEEAISEHNSLVSDVERGAIYGGYTGKVPLLMEDLLDQHYQEKHHDSPVPHIYMPLVDGLIGLGKIEDAKKVFGQSLQIGLRMNMVMYVTLMKLYRAEGNVDMVKALWHHLGKAESFMLPDFGKIDGITDTNTQFALSVLIDTLLEVNAFDDIKTAWSDLEANQYLFDAHNYNRYVCALIKMGQVNDACAKANQLLQQPATSNRRPRDHADTYSEQLYRGTKTALAEAHDQDANPFKVYPMVLEAIKHHDRSAPSRVI